MSEGNYMNGIDVSHWQDPSKIDYNAIAEQGYEWVIARAAYGVKPDDTFFEHIAKAKEAGLLTGAYSFYRQSQDTEEQLNIFESQINQANLDIAPVLDLEWNTDYDGPVSPTLFDTEARYIMERLREEYGECMAYLAPGFYQTIKEPEWLLDFPWWVAHYTSDPSPWCPFKDWSIWQYTGEGSVAGYSGDLDLNKAVHLPLINKGGVNPEVPTDNPYELIAQGHELIAQGYRLLK